MTRAVTMTRLGAVLAAAALVLTACGTTSTGGDAGAGGTAADAVTMTDAWVKAADEGMTAGFGHLSNGSGAEVTVTSAQTPASTVLELHETVESAAGTHVMRQVDGGFAVPAGGTLVLEPGGSHLMLMDLVGPLQAGEEVTFTLTFSDGSTFEFTAPVKDYSGANETYEHGHDHDDGGDH